MPPHPTTTASTEPIAPARFAAALTDLSLPTLHLKVLEIRNSISHLRTSNIQLLPFALGSETAVGGVPGQPDPDCAEAIRENETVIERMQERITLVRAEVESRGLGWREFESAEDLGGADDTAATTNGLRDAREEEERIAAGTTQETRAPGAGSGAVQHPAWSDGTFQTGVIRGGELQFDAVPGDSFSVPAASGANNGETAPAGTTGGRLTGEQLRRAMEQQMRDLGTDDNDSDSQGGMHL
ncbi:hypothetical protein F5X68DRAFT_205049 [Plectosphaerella plurivora]|uniref:Uncharacterized protein n=1 Tax=Plectosphaerella plurivora TaxID=936078 RepID=A0A9P9AD49_9PEZI|nr:hypothetical protein F5X68DRAFT_205049 [Plectosphaerella plurivora]